MPYVDHLYDEMDDEESYKRKNTGGVTNPFPEKLMDLMSSVDPAVIGWLPHGRGFKIRDQKTFVDRVMPNHFKHTKITSFQRQLNLYGFKRLTRGPDSGAYYHEFFLRDRPKLCMRMRRQKIKGTGHKPHHEVALEPDFYNMEPVGPLTADQERIIEQTRSMKKSGGGGRGGGEAAQSAPPASRLSASAVLPRFARTASAMIKRVSSLGSEGWSEEDLGPEVAAGSNEFMDEDPEEMAVDFDDIFKTDSIGGRNSSMTGDDATMAAMAAAAHEVQGMVTFNSSGRSCRSVLNEDEVSEDLQTSDREMGWWSGNNGKQG